MQLSPFSSPLRRLWTVGVWAACWLIFTLSVAQALIEDIRWPDGQAIQMDLQLGAPKGSLIDGAGSWDQVFQAAEDIWNLHLGSGVRLTATQSSYTPRQRDGKNTVFFNSSAYGEKLGDDTLAITVYFYNVSRVATEADIIFNSAKSFNSYRGNLRTGGNDRVIDFRRVAIHELGHVIGLGHVLQYERSIMTPNITNYDTVTDSDIETIEGIYGNPRPFPPTITSELTAKASINQPFEYRISADNKPTSYLAKNLLPGLRINGNKISGKPEQTGTFDVVIGATNTFGTGTATLRLIVFDKIQATDDLNLNAYLGKYYSYQIATVGQPELFSLGGSLPPGLSLNSKTGIISGIPKTAGGFAFNVFVTDSVSNARASFELTVAYDAALTTVRRVGEFYRDAPIFSLLKGTDGNLYGTVPTQTLMFSGTLFKIASDGMLTTQYRFGPLEYSYDLHQTPDGSFYGTTSHNGEYVGTLYKLTTNAASTGVLTELAKFPAASPTSSLATSTVLLANDGNYYCSVWPGVGEATNFGGWIYKVATDGTLTTLHIFNGLDGLRPSALIQATDGNFYGTTHQGGINNRGTIFKLTPEGRLTVMHHFDAAAGNLPMAPLLLGKDGNFYGTASAGEEGHGTVFKMTPDGTLKTVYSFKEGQGIGPTAALVQDEDGNFYGTTSNDATAPMDGSPTAILFKLTPDGNLTALHTFSGNEGSPTAVSLVPDGGGNFFGVLNKDGLDTVFKVTPSAVIPVYASPLPSVTLAVMSPTATVGSSQKAGYTVTLSEVQDHDVVIKYRVKGSAVGGTDYAPLSGTVKIKAGKRLKRIKVLPQGNLGGASKKVLTLTLELGDGYTVGTTGKVKLKLLLGQ